MQKIFLYNIYNRKIDDINALIQYINNSDNIILDIGISR